MADTTEDTEVMEDMEPAVTAVVTNVQATLVGPQPTKIGSGVPPNGGPSADTPL